MKEVIFVGFDTEPLAYRGDQALHDMDMDGTITLSNDAVVVRERSGKVAVRELPHRCPVGTVRGMIAGGLIGWLGGPAGAAVGLGAGALAGGVFDSNQDGADRDFVEEVGRLIEPGRAVVIAEIDEKRGVPLDARMAGLGGKLLRRTRTQVVDAHVDREIEAEQRELRDLETQKLAEVTVSETEKGDMKAERLQAQIDDAKRKIREKEDQLTAKMRALKREGDQKIAQLELQKAAAEEESALTLEHRLADVRSDYERRIQRLGEALARRKTARSDSNGGKQ